MTIEQLKLQIKEVIFPNGKNEIDGGKHQGVLLDLVDKFDVDVRDLARALNELSDELNNKDESQSNALRELADKVDEHVLYTDNSLSKKLEKIYTDDASVQGDGTKNNPLTATLQIGRAHV